MPGNNPAGEKGSGCRINRTRMDQQMLVLTIDDDAKALKKGQIFMVRRTPIGCD